RTTANGYIESALYGGRRPVADGVVQLLVDAGDPAKKEMRYRLFFTAAGGRELTLVGFKDISGRSAADVRPETTTLYTRILQGRVAEGDTGPVDASGVIVIKPEDFFLRQLFSFRVEGGPIGGRVQALARFGAMFFGKLWDVYGHKVGPV